MLILTYVHFNYLTNTAIKHCKHCLALLWPRGDLEDINRRKGGSSRREQKDGGAPVECGVVASWTAFPHEYTHKGAGERKLANSNSELCTGLFTRNVIVSRLRGEQECIIHSTQQSSQSCSSPLWP